MSLATSERLDTQQIQNWIVDRIATAIGMEPESLDVNAPLTDHGLDSVSALQMTGELEELVRRPLSATLLWEYPTISLLSRHLASGA